MKSRIVLIEDNAYEADILNASLAQLNYHYQITYFSNPLQAYKYLHATSEKIFLIISDMHMPKLNGLELRKMITDNKKLRTKSIPFIIFSNTASPNEIREAYTNGVHGYFQKPEKIEEAIKMLDIIIKYWQRCKQPDKLDDN